MTDIRMKSEARPEASQPSRKQRKPYSKPCFRAEQVFESLLCCGKFNEAACHGFKGPPKNS